MLRLGGDQRAQVRNWLCHHARRLPLGDDEGALPVIAAFEQNEHVAALYLSAQSAAGTALGHLEPQDIDRRAQIMQGQETLATNQRGSTVCHHDKPSSMKFLARRGNDTGDTPAFLRKLGNLLAHREMKAGKSSCFIAQEVEQVPLRHHGDERSRRA